MNFEKNDVLLAIQKNNVAFSNLYQSIYADLYKMAYYIIGNRELAEDIVSDTVLDAYRNIATLRDPDKFESWILKILTNQCKKMMRGKYSKFSVFNPNARNPEDYPLSSGNDLSTQDDMTDIVRAMSHLSYDDKLIISLCIVEGYKSTEVAQILSMKPSTVRSRLNRGLAKMRKYLEVKENEK